VLDHRGLPKVAYSHLRRACAPVAVWTTDEGVAGVAIHAANDRPEPLRARLRVALYRDLEVPVAEAVEEIEIRPHGSLERNVEGMLGRFVDAAWAYRFGRPGHDAIVVSLESAGEPAELLSQSVRFPAGRPAGREPAKRMGIEVSSETDGDGGVVLRLRSRRLAYGVRLSTPGFVADDDAFSVVPGSERVVRLLPSGSAPFAGGSLVALNLDGPVKIPAPPA
jgi:beta-mannosidase